MMEIIHHPHDKDLKFKYKRFAVPIHNYFFDTEYTTVEFLDTAEAETGKREDILCIFDGKYGCNVENESTNITDDDTFRFHGYNRFISSDTSNPLDEVFSYSICTAKPQREPILKFVEDNYIFVYPVIYTKNTDGQKVLTILKDKVEKQERLTDEDLVNLLYLVDSNIDMPIDKLMKEIIYIVRNANIPQDVYEDLVACFTITLKRFFKGEKLSEMMTLLQKNEDEKIAAIVDKYGIGFDDVYKDGKYEGEIKGINDTKIKNAKNLLAKGISEDIISECIGISITELENLKREL